MAKGAILCRRLTSGGGAFGDDVGILSEEGNLEWGKLPCGVSGTVARLLESSEGRCCGTPGGPPSEAGPFSRSVMDESEGLCWRCSSIRISERKGGIKVGFFYLVETVPNSNSERSQSLHTDNCFTY